MVVGFRILVVGLEHVLCFHILGIVIPIYIPICQRGWFTINQGLHYCLCGSFMGRLATGGDLFDLRRPAYTIGAGISFQEVVLTNNMKLN